MKKSIALLLAALTVFLALAAPCSASDTDSSGEEIPADAAGYGFTVEANGALLMEAETGTVLYEQNADQAYPPASVTKIMTLLLVMEAIDSGKIKLTDQVPVSENAASMGGSQVFLEAGEEMPVEEMLKCTIISSANDAAVALAEFVSGSETAFVSEMNARAAALGMKNSTFENVTGLDDTTVNHATSARDIAIMSRALISHPLILKYSSIWMDSIRDGAFTLSNTNRLIRFYQGANGLKTGSTGKAKFCISATATRNGMTLISVIMGSPTRDVRNEAAKKLLDYGFANYALYTDSGKALAPLPVLGGVFDQCGIAYGAFSTVVKKSELGSVKQTCSYPDSLEAPVRAGDEIGTVTYTLGDSVIGTVPILATDTVGKITFRELLWRMFRQIVFS